MRLRSDIWVSAYIRRCASEGAAAQLRRRGAAEAGAIYVKIDRLDGTAALYAVSQDAPPEASGIDRLFARQHREAWIESAAVEKRMARAIEFDGDLWFVEAEDRKGEARLDLADGEA